jgi:hypothetical protein
MKLPNPPVQYDQSFESQRNGFIEQMDKQSLKRQADVEIVDPQRFILRSPNGNRWQITVSNVGVLVATAL